MDPSLQKLTPAEQEAFDGLITGLEAENIIILRGPTGSGKTTILRHVAAAKSVPVIGARAFIEALKVRPAMAIEETFLDLLDEALDREDIVLVDDLNLLTDVTNHDYYPRHDLLDLALAAVCERVRERGKRIVFATLPHSYVPSSISESALGWKVEPCVIADYKIACSAHLTAEQAGALDFAKIFAFAPQLSLHDLVRACRWTTPAAKVDTETFIGHLSEYHMISNVKIDEVARVTWKDLKGVDDVIRALEAKIALPFENLDLASKLGLKPKRGVLLAGPPGTGKTTIGRALAHRLKGKFFLIDGTMVSGSDGFYNSVGKVFAEAKQNAPSVIFIDDSDVIFANDGDKGFYRYLLTRLDGLEGKADAHVCVMMTAMDAGSLPPALLRSGRIELWLETRLPDDAARAEILRDHLSNLPPEFTAVDISVLSSASRGLTGADLKAVVEDAKLLWAHDAVEGKTPRQIEYYFLEAMDTVRANKRKYHRRKPEHMAEPGVYDFPRI